MAWKLRSVYDYLPMKPKDLRFPYSWEERKPLLQDNILFIPHYYFCHENWTMPQFSTIFRNDKPINAEFCSGNGEWVINKALKQPECNWIAVEKNFDRVRKIWSKRENLQLKNLLIVSGYAEELTKYYLPDHCLSNVFVNFPDPWPKDKHAKNRLFQPTFIENLSRKLIDSAMAYLVTDDFDYLQQMIREMLKNTHWTAYFPHPFYRQNPSHYGESWFERLWKKKGRNIFHAYFQLRKGDKIETLR